MENKELMEQSAETATTMDPELMVNSALGKIGKYGFAVFAGYLTCKYGGKLKDKIKGKINEKKEKKKEKKEDSKPEESKEDKK